MYKSTQSYIVN